MSCFSCCSNKKTNNEQTALIDQSNQDNIDNTIHQTSQRTDYMTREQSIEIEIKTKSPTNKEKTEDNNNNDENEFLDQKSSIKKSKKTYYKNNFNVKFDKKINDKNEIDDDKKTTKDEKFLLNIGLKSNDFTIIDKKMTTGVCHHYTFNGKHDNQESFFGDQLKDGILYYKNIQNTNSSAKSSTKVCLFMEKNKLAHSCIETENGWTHTLPDGPLFVCDPNVFKEKMGYSELYQLPTDIHKAENNIKIAENKKNDFQNKISYLKNMVNNNESNDINNEDSLKDDEVVNNLRTYCQYNLDMDILDIGMNISKIKDEYSFDESQWKIYQIFLDVEKMSNKSSVGLYNFAKSRANEIDKFNIDDIF